jgi:hypothetical protein
MCWPATANLRKVSSCCPRVIFDLLQEAAVRAQQLHSIGVPAGKKAFKPSQERQAWFADSSKQGKNCKYPWTPDKRIHNTESYQALAETLPHPAELVIQS